MKALKIPYSPLKGQTDVCFWHPSIDPYFSPSQFHRYPKDIPRELRLFLDKLYSERQAIKWTAVTLEDVPQDYNRTIYRGYSDGGEIKNPIIIRGRPLEEVEAKVQWYPHDSVSRVYFSGNYSRPLSSGEKSKLEEWFGERLIAASTGALLYDLRKAVRDRSIRDTMKYLGDKITEAHIALEEIRRDKALHVR